MQLKKIGPFILLFLATGMFAQPPIPLSKKFFTLRNARFSFGVNISGNVTLEDKEQNKRFNIFNFAPNNLSDDYKVDYTGEDVPYLSGGIIFDLFSPNSILGLSFGAEYNLLNYGFKYNDNLVSTIKTQHLRFPAYLKFLTGQIHDQISGVIMAGGYYTLPVSYERDGPDVLSKDTKELENGLSASTILGIQYRFFDESEQLIEGIQSSRIWLYLRADYSFYTPFSAPTMLTIVQASDGSFSFRPLNFSIGLGYFL